MPKVPRQIWEGWAEFWSSSRKQPYWENPNLPKGMNTSWNPPPGWPFNPMGQPDYGDSRGSHVRQPRRSPPNAWRRVEEEKIELPPGWIETFDESRGLPYYYCEETQISQWQRPVSSPKYIPSYQLLAPPPPSRHNGSNGQQQYVPNTIVSSDPSIFDNMSNSHAEASTSSVVPVDGVAGVGKSFLTDLARRHSKWLWGGLAEILHNSRDAGSKNIEIQRFPDPNSTPNQSDFGLRIDDDGSGLTYDEACTMMQIASDKNFKAKEGKVGGYGVGFKVGAIAMAQTAIVLSISLKDENTGTTVVGVLSNEPFEERGEFPLGLRRPNTEIIALWTKNGRVYEKKGVKEADRDELCKKIKQLNSSIDRDWITTWAGARQGKSGTTIILCGVRHMFRGNDLGQSFKAHTPPRIRIDFINPHDMVLMEFDDLRKVSVPFRHHPTARRIIGHAAKMDSSLRAFCEIMFLMEGPSKHISINLFGKPVKRVCYNKVLRNKMPDKLKDGKNIINCMLGQHTFRDDEDLYGAMLYCEGTLITAYARPHNLEFRRSRNNNNDDEEHFSSVLVVDLKKQHGFEPTPEKLEFNFNDAKKERFWDAVKGKIEEYADKQASLRDEKFPLRPLFFNCIKDLKVRLRDYEGDYSEEGPLRGVLFIPGRESDSSDHETYHGFIKDPISLKDIERKIKQEGSARPIYVGDAEDKTLAFKKDITKVLKNSIKWESEGRFIADTVEDLDINDVTAGDIDAATTQPFVCPSSGTKGPFTIKDMLKKLDIPDEFKKATFEANRSAYPEMKDWTTELNHSTTLLVPHRRSVAAVKFAKRLLTIVDEQVEGFPAIIRSKKRAKEKGTVDDLVQCSLCQNWRKFPGAVIKYGEVNFTCEMEGRSCEEPDDYNRHTDIHLSSHRDNDHSVGSPVVTENSSDDNLDVSQGKKRRRVYTSDSSEDMKSRVKIKNSTIEGEIGKKVRTRPISPVSRAAASFAHPLNDVPRKRRRNKKPPTIEIGSKIKKWFEDELNSGWRFGTVVSLKSLANPHYIISYTNGDREQYSDKEILLRYIQNDEVVPDHTPSENFTLLRSSDVLATEFVEQMEKCLAAVKNIQHVQMSKHVSEMLKIWNEAESRNQEILVYNKITLSSWTLYRALLKKAKPSKCNARFMGLLDEVRTSVREVKNKIKRMEEESTAPINVDRAPRVPHELAPSTLHKDPERVAATARGLGIENAPETHEEWLHFAKTRTEEADKLSKVLKERKEQDELEI